MTSMVQSNLYRGTDISWKLKYVFQVSCCPCFSDLSATTVIWRLTSLLPIFEAPPHIYPLKVYSFMWEGLMALPPVKRRDTIPGETIKMEFITAVLLTLWNCVSCSGEDCPLGYLAFHLVTPVHNNKQPRGNICFTIVENPQQEFRYLSGWRVQKVS